ncbi:hypothetical protein NDU88_003810 [Pleurodeles waltl]|uniref:Uncharacterized protein n=1 Tax=Pleurodeles waltl TaxID=8319 RepID=A0AAV7SH00_PLEWA|nr:hypothetical protein NDU88_003810 [Pleurodeles waltl]
MKFCWIHERGPSESIFQGPLVRGPDSFIPGSPRGARGTRSSPRRGRVSRFWSFSGAPLFAESFGNNTRWDLDRFISPRWFSVLGVFLFIASGFTLVSRLYCLIFKCPQWCSAGSTNGGPQSLFSRGPRSGAPPASFPGPPIRSPALRSPSPSGEPEARVAHLGAAGQPVLVLLGGPSTLRASWFLDDDSSAEGWRCAGALAPSAVLASLSPRSMLATGLQERSRPPSYVLP